MHRCNRLLPEVVWKIWNIAIRLQCTCSSNIFQIISTNHDYFSNISTHSRGILWGIYSKNFPDINSPLSSQFSNNSFVFQVFIQNDLEIFTAYIFIHQRKSFINYWELNIYIFLNCSLKEKIKVFEYWKACKLSVFNLFICCKLFTKCVVKLSVKKYIMLSTSISK